MLFSFDIPHNIYCVKNNNGIVGNYMYNVYMYMYYIHTYDFLPKKDS